MTVLRTIQDFQFRNSLIRVLFRTGRANCILKYFEIPPDPFLTKLAASEKAFCAWYAAVATDPSAAVFVVFQVSLRPR